MKKISVFLCAFLLVTTSAFAHVMNKNNVFSDLSLTEVADEVVLLSALGVVSYLDDSFEFKPTEKLTAKDLGAWVASYNGLEGSTSSELAEVALDTELIQTIEGDATYQLVNEVYFNGKLILEEPEAKLTREEFALFVASHVSTDMGGHTLLDMSGYTSGPTGIIEHVERVQKKTASDKTAYVYMVTIDGAIYELGMHPRVLADSADPAVWVGQQVAESFYGPNVGTDQSGKHMHHDHAHHEAIAEEEADMANDTVAKAAIQFLVIGDAPFTVKQKEAAREVPVAEASAVEEALTNVETVETEEEPASNTLWIMIVVVAVLAIAGIAMKKSKKA